MKKLLFASLLLSLLIAVTTSCEKAESEYSSYPCRFIYNNGLYLDLTLASAMNADAAGVFCHISETSMGGTRYLVFRNSNGDETRKQEMAQEQQASYILGLNNGIIVGYQTMDNGQRHGPFAAYDAQCSICVRESGNTLNPKFPLAMSSNGIATCSVCQRKYDLNNAGYIQNPKGSDDRKLIQYVASTTGPYGTIVVSPER